MTLRACCGRDHREAPDCYRVHTAGCLALSEFERSHSVLVYVLGKVCLGPY